MLPVSSLLLSFDAANGCQVLFGLIQVSLVVDKNTSSNLLLLAIYSNQWLYNIIGDIMESTFIKPYDFDLRRNVWENNEMKIWKVMYS